MQLGVSISKTVFELAQAGELDADYIVYYGQLGGKYLNDLLPIRPLMLHDLPEPFWLNYENPFTDEVVRVGRMMLDAIRPPWFSTGVGASAEPQAHRDGPYREGNPEDLQPREVVIANITKHGKRLVEWAGIPVLLENFNYHATNAYEYICEPDVFTQLLEATGTGMLLDLAHARISAYNMDWASEKDYLQALPLQQCREIHITRPGWQNGQRVDLHSPIGQEELDLLGWVLERSATEAVTLEVEELPIDVLRAQLKMLREFLS
ncbi:MAG: DUF692 family protein [Anaerolineae bacterium]|nr:DUF692 family protein [Anaerolineae bacterium]